MSSVNEPEWQGNTERSALGQPVAEAVRPEVAVTLVTVIHRLRRAVLLIDDEGRLLFANNAARRMLGEGDAIREIEGRLQLCSASRMQRLKAYLDRQMPSPPDSPSLLLKLDRASGEPAFRMLVLRLDPADCAELPSCYLVMLFDPQRARAVESAVLQRVYGLTPAEGEIATQLISGLSVAQAAATVGASPSTVRTHLRNIFRKCEVDSQAELLQMLALGPRRL